MICKKNNCVGCFACYNICPRNAISMLEDDNGFVYPHIDCEKCVNCGLCNKVCPANNKLGFNEVICCYAAQRKDVIKLKESSSGGAASVFSEYIIKNNGVVYGAAFESEFKIHHIRIDNLADLVKFKGSKYVHSYIEDTYKMVKKDLISNKSVLFIGTPCQIAGLKLFLMKEYENLLCVDLICHGVPSQAYLKSELMADGIDLMDINDIKFRKNNQFKIVVKSSNKILMDKNMADSRYYCGFMDSFFYRENCYECKFASDKRISDITIGDFWGLGNDSKLFANHELGVSVILVCSDKGRKFISKCLKEFNYEVRPLSEAVNGNTQLRCSAKKNRKYNRFKKDYCRYGFYKAFDKSNVLQTIKKKLKKYKIINYLYNKIKGVYKK